MTTVSFRNRAGQLVDVPVVSATRLKNEFGAVIDQAALNGAVVITKHATPKAVLMSYAEFEALTAPAAPRSTTSAIASTSCWPPCRLRKPKPVSPPRSTPPRRRWVPLR